MGSFRQGAGFTDLETSEKHEVAMVVVRGGRGRVSGNLFSISPFVYILSVVSVVSFSSSSFPIERFPADKRKASRPHISNPARVCFTPCGRKSPGLPTKG